MAVLLSSRALVPGMHESWSVYKPETSQRVSVGEIAVDQPIDKSLVMGERFTQEPKDLLDATNGSLLTRSCLTSVAHGYCHG